MRQGPIWFSVLLNREVNIFSPWRISSSFSTNIFLRNICQILCECGLGNTTTLSILHAALKKNLLIVRFISWNMIMSIPFQIPICNFQTTIRPSPPEPERVHFHAATPIDLRWCRRSIWAISFHFAACLEWCMLALSNWAVQPLPRCPLLTFNGRSDEKENLHIKSR